MAKEDMVAVRVYGMPHKKLGKCEENGRSLESVLKELMF